MAFAAAPPVIHCSPPSPANWSGGHAPHPRRMCYSTAALPPRQNLIVCNDSRPTRCAERARRIFGPPCPRRYTCRLPVQGSGLGSLMAEVVERSAGDKELCGVTAKDRQESHDGCMCCQLGVRVIADRNVSRLEAPDVHAHWPQIKKIWLMGSMSPETQFERVSPETRHDNVRIPMSSR